MIPSRRAILPLLALALVPALCLGIPAMAQDAASDAPKSGRLPVVATFSILADFVKSVGGERIEVTSLVGPNGDAHVYSPTPQDAKNLKNARVVFVNGLKLEGWIDRLITSSGTKAPIIVATKGVKPIEMSRREEGSKTERIGVDPHAWQDIANARIYVANIRDALSSADPEGASTYSANAAAYLKQLHGLEAEVRQAIARIPPERRRIITTHDAFGYFGRAYGFEFIAPQGVSTETEASAKDVAKIIRQIKAEKIPAVFFENISDPRLIKRIADETGTKIGGTLFSDALSDDKGPAATYIDMMRHNIGEFDAALSS